MAFPNYPATSFEQAVDLAIFSSNQLGGIINEDATTEIDTVSGKIPTVRKALVDNFFFKSPIAWVNGQQETVFNQLRYFENDILSGYYYAPKATSTNPVAMGSSPVTDDNWVLYSLQKEQVPSEVYPWLYEAGNPEDTVITPPYVFDSAIVTINGVVQIPDVAYNIVNSQIILKEPLGLDPQTGNTNLLFAYLGKVEDTGDGYIQSTILASNIGSSLIGEVASCPALRSLLPTRTNQKVEVKGYNAGSSIGGGKFYYVADTTTPDDGGVFFRVNSNGGWKRATPDTDNLNIQHFGAVTDGVTNDADAIVRMHNWSVSIDSRFGPGVILPPGKTAVDTINLGTAEIPSFKIRGPQRDYGHLVSATLVPFSKTQTTPMFTFCARYMEVSNMRFLGTGSVQPYFVNTVTRGSYVRVHSIRADGLGGRAFQVIDSIDTKFDQVFSYNAKAAFLWVTWSNLSPGAWDHPTAIEITNFMFQSHTNEYAVSAIRAGQSMMYNGWFNNCEYPFDISQGGWTLDNITMENSTNPAAVQYAKLLQIYCRWAQGAGLDYTASGYTRDMDLVNGGSGNIPNWVTNGYDQGTIQLTPQASKFDGGLASKFDYSSLIMENLTAQTQWVQVGRLMQQGQGHSFKLRVLGINGWDSTGSSISRPDATNFGGGEAIIHVEAKAPASANGTAGEVHWYATGSSPIVDVKYVHYYSYTTVYVKMATYCRYAAVFVETTGQSRLQAGTPFWFRQDNTVMTEADVLAVANITNTVKRWAINGGGYGTPGIGMDLDNGSLLLNAATVTNAASRHLPVSLYGTKYYVPMQDTNQSLRVPVYAYADLPAATTNVYGIILCRDTTLAQPMQPLFSNGTKWFLLSDPSNSTWQPA